MPAKVTKAFVNEAPASRLWMPISSGSMRALAGLRSRPSAYDGLALATAGLLLGALRASVPMTSAPGLASTVVTAYQKRQPEPG